MNGETHDGFAADGRVEGRCVLCGSRQAPEPVIEAPDAHGACLLSGELFRLVRCRGCRIIYIDPCPEASRLKACYDRGYYRRAGVLATLEKAFTSFSNARKRALIERFARGGRILDVGCGDGSFLESFIGRKGWKAYGVEPSAAGHKLTKAKGIRVFRSELCQCGFPEGHFDAVTMWHVLEHASDPVRLLKEARRVLAPNGVFVLGIPNIKGAGFALGGNRWFHLDAPRHLFHYDSESASFALMKAGLKPVKVSYPVMEYPLDLYHSVTGALRPRSMKIALAPVVLALSLGAKPVLSVMKASETMFIICRKDKKNGD
ncbi:MAG: hypothetical protein A2V21_304650 [Deltaproteobacteria bacterium GWC2_55_46]|nr:MAG: hypothetical protein A2V21_304650 [Deltaproteobacteria bacterium GWC2_55_46]